MVVVGRMAGYIELMAAIGGIGLLVGIGCIELLVGIGHTGLSAGSRFELEHIEGLAELWSELVCRKETGQPERI